MWDSEVGAEYCPNCGACALYPFDISEYPNFDYWHELLVREEQNITDPIVLDDYKDND